MSYPARAEGLVNSTFPKGICPKVNVIARLEYELAYYDSAVHRFTHYATRTPPPIFFEKDFNSALYLICCTKFIFLFEYKGLSKFCMINAKSGYSNLFLFGFSKKLLCISEI